MHPSLHDLSFQVDPCIEPARGPSQLTRLELVDPRRVIHDRDAYVQPSGLAAGHTLQHTVAAVYHQSYREIQWQAIHGSLHWLVTWLGSACMTVCPTSLYFFSFCSPDVHVLGLGLVELRPPLAVS
jgi:hypothetical protein